MWVITQSVNDYSQHGEYFIAAFREKPKGEQVKGLLEVNNELADEFVSNENLDLGGVEYFLYNLKGGEKIA